MNTRFFTSILTVAALLVTPAFAQKKAKEAKDAVTQASETAATKTPAASKAPAAVKPQTHKGGPSQNASATEIADAKTKGLVWVNTGTGVFHKDGEYFGATKEGKFMTEADAIKAGHRAAKDNKVVAKGTKPAASK